MPNNRTYRFSDRKSDKHHHHPHHHHPAPYTPFPPYKPLPPWFWLLEGGKF